MLAGELNLFNMQEKREGMDLWKMEGMKGTIKTEPKQKPIFIPQYRQPHFHMEEAEKMTKDWIKQGLVRNSFSSWNAPILLIKKPKGKLRFCVNYRRLNNVTSSNSS